MPRASCATMVVLVHAFVAISQATSSEMSMCPKRTVLTSNCPPECRGNALCTRFRASYSTTVDRSTFSEAFNVDSNGCTFRCMVTVVDPVRRTLSVQLEGYEVDVAEDERDGSKVEDIAALELPANITGLEIAVVGNTPALFLYPDGNIVANSTRLEFLRLENVALLNLPESIYQLPVSSLSITTNMNSFPVAISAFKNVSTLILDGSSLMDFPTVDVVRDMSQVRSLSLAENQISQITVNTSTDDIYSKSRLRSLDMTRNRLSVFDAVLPELEVLHLNGNQLTKLPSSLWRMPKLRQLQTDHNPLVLPDLDGQLSAAQPLPATQHLSLRACGLEDSTLALLASVFTNLTHLDVTLNGLTKIQRDGLPATTLQHLNISGNNLTFFEASLPSLRALDLSFNQIAAFEWPINSSSSLQTLDVSHNALQSLPASLPATISKLNASQNEITLFPVASLPDLQVLDLSYNKLTRFPGAAVWSASSLKVLLLDGNPTMAAFKVTPAQFHKLESLSEFTIDASVNSGVACPPDSTKITHGVVMCVLFEPVDGEGSNSRTDTDVVVMAASGESRQGAIITTIILVIAGALFGIGAYWHSRWRQQKAIDSHTHRAGPDSRQRRAAKSLTSRRDDLSRSDIADLNIWNDSLLLQLRVDMETVRFVNAIGSGSYGQVWRGMCRSPTIRYSHVAVKTLSSDIVRDRHTVKRFVAEIKLQASLCHPRIVEIVAVAWTSLSDLCVLQEFMPRGDLFSSLHSSSSPLAMFQLGVWGESKLQIALDIVEVLGFVHALSPAVVHRDLTSRNVLLDIHGRAKVSDFRVARRSSVKNTAIAGSRSPWWIAPEVILGKADYDSKADVYSFGVILSELDTHETPYSAEIIDTTVALLRSMDTTQPMRGRATPSGAGSRQLSSRDSTNRIKATARRHTLHQIATGDLRPQFSSSCPRAIHDIAQRCLARDPALRPDAEELHHLFRRVEMDGDDARVSILV